MSSIKLVDVQGLTSILEVNPDDQNYKEFLEKRRIWRLPWIWKIDIKEIEKDASRFLGPYLEEIGLPLQKAEFPLSVEEGKKFKDGEYAGKNKAKHGELIKIFYHFPAIRFLSLDFRVLTLRKSNRISAAASIFFDYDNVLQDFFKAVYSGIRQGNEISSPRFGLGEGFEVASLEQILRVLKVIQEGYSHIEGHLKELNCISDKQNCEYCRIKDEAGKCETRRRTPQGEYNRRLQSYVKSFLETKFGKEVFS